MSIKKTKIHYPHIVKEYESVAQLIEENGYSDFHAAMLAGLTQFGIDVNDETQYKESLSDDLFEAIATVVFPSEEEWNTYDQSIESDPEFKMPIFVEDSEDHII